MKLFKLFISFLGVLILSGLFGCDQSLNSEVKTIGVLQYMEHAALDASYEGFMTALEDNGYIEGETIQIDFKNAQGDIATTQTIAKQFVSTNVDMIFAIATGAAQAAYNATQDIPIVITAVTDPVSAGIVQSWDLTGTNVTGTSDLTPVAKQMELIKDLVPDTKTIGVIYTTSEINSQVQVSMAKEAAHGLGFEIVEVGITSVNDIPIAVSSIIDKIDVLYAPTDNLIASSMPVLWNTCVDKKIPIFTGEEGMTLSGGIATEGIDYYQLGYQTGLMAIEVLEGKDPSTMSIQTLENTTFIVNKKNADMIGLEIPEDMLSQAEIVEGD